MLVKAITFFVELSFCRQHTHPISKATCLIDSETSSWNMSPRHLAEAYRSSIVRESYQSYYCGRLYGQAAHLKQLLAVADPYGIPIIEDAAECLELFTMAIPVDPLRE